MVELQQNPLIILYFVAMVTSDITLSACGLFDFSQFRFDVLYLL